MHGFGEGRGRKPSGPSQVRAPEGDHTPVRFIIDGERRLVIARFGESLMATDIQNYAKALSAHPDFDPSFSEIADISNVKELPLEGADFLRLADQIDPFSLESKRAFVAQTPTQRHAVRMHKILRNQRNFEIFQTVPEAEYWVNSGTKPDASET